MMDERKLWNAANLLIYKHGYDAEEYAGLRAEEARLSSDEIGCEVWKDIAQAVHQLDQDMSPSRH